MKRVSSLFCLGFFLLFCLTPAFAQTGTTSLRGTVMDKSGAAILGADVKISNPQTAFERSSTSGSTGEYEFPGLPPGTYVLTVEKENFGKYEQNNVQLLVNTPATLNVTLQVGSVNQTIEVSAAAITLNTTDASVGNAFNENQVKQLPMEGRNVPDLLSLQAGVAYTGNRTDVPADDTRSGAVNGARSDQSNLTLDGIEVNDEGGHAFTSVLPVTLDSVQEFRVTTTNANADQGGSSGAQVALVTKSGTNDFHGSVYEYHRNTYTSANDYFVKSAELQNCTASNVQDCNTAPKLIRNIFGGSVGGPIKKDRLFLFLNYEGTRRSEQVSETNPVPSASLRDGVIFYQCDSTSPTVATDCPGGTVTGLSGKPYTIPAPVISGGTTIAYNALSPQQITQIDPRHLGPNAAALTYFNTYPAANVPSFGDGLNYQGFNWAAPIYDRQNIYIAKMDYNVTRDAKHHISVTGALRNDSNDSLGAPFFPGQAPSDALVNYNKGIIVNYSGAISNTLVNSFRYGFVRESVGLIGNSNQQWILLRGLNDTTGAITRTNSFQRPVHNFADDLSWIHGKHTFQFGGQVARIREPRTSFRASFSEGVANAGWFNTTGFAGKPSSPLNPANNPSGAGPCDPTTGAGCLPGVDSGFFNSYDFPLTALMGMVSQVSAQYNFGRDGSALPQGASLKRNFAIDSYEIYAQDVWKIKPTLTITLGLRYSLFSPPWETKGLQVSPTENLGTWFANRASEGANGIPSNQDNPVAFNWSGPANGGTTGFYNWDYKNLGPRVAFAWSPNKTTGLLGSVFGAGKTAIRGGFGIVYDRFGQGLVDDFDTFGSFGLATTLTNNAVDNTVQSVPRMTDIHTIPTTDNNGNQIFLPAPAANFPVPFPPGNFTATTGLDASLKTPYSYTIDLSVGRELKGGFSLEVAYVGRLSHRLLTQEDLAMPLDFKDKASGLDYFTAVQALAKLYRPVVAGGQAVTDNTFKDSMVSPAVAQYWGNVLQRPTNGGAYSIGVNGLTGGCGSGGPTATTDPLLAAFDLFCGGNFNETTPLQFLDSAGIPDATGDPNCGAAGHPPCQYFPIGGPFTFYTPQYASLYAWRSIGKANYHAMQVTLRHKMSHGVQFDFNYTLSKSIDLSSDAERVGTFLGIGGGEVINSWSPNLFRAVSDFDATHQFNGNWVADLPFGRGKRIGRDSNRMLDALIGGWQLSGLFRLTSGFPISVFNGFNFPTNWDLGGNAVLVGQAPKTGAYKNPSDGSVNVFAVGGNAAASYFREPLPGEAGQRNILHGDGFFGVDMGLAKRWTMPWTEKQSLQFRWEVFNITNSTRFDAQSSLNVIDTYGSQFGNYTRLLTNPRVMQFALRYEF
ncbi:MAG: carboxypeptidase regulatory-like domain-containing protein [Candidatus Acidiferrales bacterium]